MRCSVRFSFAGNVFDVLFRALHGRQAAGIFAGKGFGASLKEQNEKISANESVKRRYGSLNDFAASLCGPGHASQFVLPG